MKNALTILSVVLVSLAAAWMGSARAESNTVDDLALLAGKGFGDEVLLAYVDRAEGSYTLSVDQVVKLKEAGLSEKVIAAVLRKRAPATSDAQPTRELLTSGNRIVYQSDRPATTAREPLTTLVYQPSTTYVPTYSSGYYYPSSYYPSSYYPASYYPSYYSPYRYYGSYYPSLYFSFGSSYSSWGWGRSCGSYYGSRGYGGFFGGHHSGGRSCGGGRR